MTVAQPVTNFFGGKNFEGVEMFDLGEKQYFCLGRRFSKHKMIKYAENLRDHCLPWLRL